MALSLEDLRAFTLVVRERSVSRAAAQLGVTQQSASERIRRLERRLGVELFVRRSHGMEPSAAGYRMLPFTQRALALLDQAVAVVADDDLLRVSVHRTTADVVVPVLEGSLTGSRLDLSVESEGSDVLAAVAEGRADVGFGSFTTVEPSASLAPTPASGEVVDGSDENGSSRALADPVADVTVEVLLVDPVIWVAPPDHPLAKIARPVSAMELARYAGSIEIGTTAEAASSNGSSNHADGDAAQGLRIATRSKVAPALEGGELVEIPVDAPGWVLAVSIAYRSTDRERPAIKALRTAMLEEHQKAQAPDAGSRPSPMGVGPQT